MQKLDLRTNLKDIIEKTKSKTILEFFNNVNPEKPGTYSSRLLNILIESKAGFDQSVLDERQIKILKQFDAKKYYETNFFSILLKFVSTNNYERTKQFLQQSNQMSDFYTFHNSLNTTFNLVENLLFQNEDLKESVEADSYEDAENKGFISFEIISDNSIDFQSFSIVIAKSG